jgi:hypothetical protein
MKGQSIAGVVEQESPAKAIQEVQDTDVGVVPGPVVAVGELVVPVVGGMDLPEE